VSGYLDAATAMPLHPAAAEVLQAALADGWADPDRLYREGRQARLLLDGAREAVAAEVGARADEVTFTPSGTAAAHVAVLGLLAGRARAGPGLVVSAVEHSSVLAAAQWHADAGGDVTTVGVDTAGRVDPAAYREALGPRTAAASLQSANHEVGTLQPVGAVAAACSDAGVPLHVDAAQSLPWASPADGWSVLTGSARKWGGPAGVGVLAIRRGTRWRRPGPEDEHEAGRGTGPVALPLVLAAAAALQAQRRDAIALASRLRRLSDRLRSEVPRRVADVELLGPDAGAERLPHLVAFSCLYVAGEAVLTELDRAGFSVSSGSSCSSSALTPSHVLEAMGVLTHGNVRVSMSTGTSDADVERLLDVLPPIVADLRRRGGAEGL
jgi:cysteine desulfurase